MIEDNLKNIETQVQQIRDELSHVTRVSDQTSLQNAIDNLPLNSTILIKPGTYDSVILRSGRHNLTLAPDTDLPITQRVENEWTDALIKVKAFRCELRAEGYTLTGFKFLPSFPGAEIITIGSELAKTPEELPNDIAFNQCIVNADKIVGGKRGVRFNARHISFLNGRVEGFKYSADSQAILVYNGPGPYIIHNNYLEASGENFLAGGATSFMQPEYVEFTNNHCFKPESWITEPDTTVKNLFELKDCLRSKIENNLFEGCWMDGQVGYAIVFSPRNQYNNQPSTVVKNVEFRWNVVRNSGAGFNILGKDTNAPSQVTENILIENNLIEINPTKFPGSAGVMFFITHSPIGVTIRNNTGLGMGKINSFMSLEHKPIRLKVNDNLFTEGEYGLKTLLGLGSFGFVGSTTESEFLRNTIITSGYRNINYGLGNVKQLTSNSVNGVDMVELRRRVTF